MTTVLDALTSANGIPEGVEATLTPSGTRLTWNVYRPTGSLVGKYANQEAALGAASADAIRRQQLGVYRVLPPTRLELNIVGFGVTTVPPPQASGDVWVEQISYSGLETRQVVLSVRRGAASNGAIAVDWALSGFAQGTPAPASGTLNWVAGETGLKSVTVTLGSVTGDQVGAFTLSNARLVTGVGSLQAPRILTAVSAVTIVNDATAPTVPVFSATATGQNSASVALTTPATDVGGLGVASYRVEYKRAVDATWTLLAAAATPGQFPLAIPSGLIAGTSYQVRGNAADAASPPNVSAFSAIAPFTTQAASDTTPDAFSFADQFSVALSTLVTSAPITVAGINAAAPISVTGGEYSINGGAFTSAAGTVTNGQQVRVRHTSSGANSASVNTTLTIGGVSDTFTSTTLASTAPPSLAGWTDLDALMNSPAYAASRIVYVSTSGNNATAQIYSPSSPALGGVPTNPTGTIAPYATLAAAWAQIRDGFADVMLMRRGDIFTSGLSLNKSGASPTARIIVSSYGPIASVRPTVRGALYPESFAEPGPRNQILAHYELDWLTTAIESDQTIRAYGSANDTSITMEGIFFRGNALTRATVFLLASRGNFRVFRCGFSGVSPYSVQSDLPGWVTYEENVGYKDPNYIRTRGFDHNNYFNYDSPDWISIGNISAFSSGNGFRQRGMGRIERNLVMEPDLTAFDLGTAIDDGRPGGRSSYLEFRYNLDFGGGTVVYNPMNAIIEQNISYGDWIWGENAGTPGQNASNVTFQDNIQWNAGILPTAGHLGTITGPFLIRRNDFQRPAGGTVMWRPSGNGYQWEANNRFFSTASQGSWFAGEAYATYIPSRGSNTQVSYPDPGRNMVRYMQSLGAAPSSVVEATEWFINGVPGNPALAGAMANRLGAWDERFTARAVINYVRAGFGRGAIP